MRHLPRDEPSLNIGWISPGSITLKEANKRCHPEKSENAGVIFGAGMTQTKEGRFEIAHPLKRRLKIAAP
jgi:hypothetical protein